MARHRGKGTSAVIAAAMAALLLAAPASAAPANDQVSGAEVISTFPAAVPATTIGATGEPGETGGFGNPATESVWFKWSPGAAVIAVVDVCTADVERGGETDSIAVYTGSSETFSGLTKVAETAGLCKLRFTAVEGNTYKIQVDFLHKGANFTFRLRQVEPPANDNFGAAQNLGNGLPVSVPGSTIEASAEAGEPGILGGSDARSVWFTWTAPKTGQVEVSGCPFETLRGFAANHALGIYTGASLGTLNPLAQTTNCTADINVNSGIEYKIAFSGNIRGEGSFSLGILDAPKPPNDDLVNATALGPALPLAVHGNNQFATSEGGEGSLELSGVTGTNHSVWYRWTAPSTERVKINACSATRQPLLGVFTGGTTIASLVVATEKQNAIPYCSVELNAVAGTTYKIGIAAQAGFEFRGPFDLNIHKVSRPANDNLIAAIPLGPALPIAVDGDNSDATEEIGEPPPAPMQLPIATVWYRWTSPITGPVDISTCGSAADDTVSVHRGATFADMTLVAPSKGEEEPGPCPLPAANGSTDRFNAVAGATYSIQVGSGFLRGLEGPFHLTITDPNQKPLPSVPPPGPAIALPIAAAHHPTLRDAIASCRSRFKGKARKARARRSACIRRAHLKFALAQCRTLGKSKQKACVATARKRYAGRKHRRT